MTLRGTSQKIKLLMRKVEPKESDGIDEINHWKAQIHHKPDHAVIIGGGTALFLAYNHIAGIGIGIDR